ncbi:MAG: hypothetical protein P9M15_01195 [Candidatus Electryoneaceae bacterium]|nr:hypothetical protein [Candidatus Electryoneaceae bacterium]
MGWSIEIGEFLMASNKASKDNRSNQLNPNNQASRDNRADQLNPNNERYQAPEPSTKPTSDGDQTSKK